MKVLKILAAVLAVLVIGGLLFVQSATTVRQLKEHASLEPNGKALKTRTDAALDYAVATRIAAPPAIVWAVLTDAAAYKDWNSTVVSLDGAISPGSTLKLVSKSAPDRTFNLSVSELDAPKRMVWEDGGKMFLGVRTFSLTEQAGATVFAMNETYSGRMLGMVEGSLPDFTQSFEAFAADLKKQAEARAPPPPAVEAPAPAADAGTAESVEAAAVVEAAPPPPAGEVPPPPAGKVPPPPARMAPPPPAGKVPPPPAGKVPPPPARMAPPPPAGKVPPPPAGKAPPPPPAGKVPPPPAGKAPPPPPAGKAPPPPPPAR